MGTIVIDADGFRPNVGIIVTNGEGRILWARRIGSQNAWQFPQGGVREGEAAIDAMYRELLEELGLRSEHVEVIAESRRWERYRLPKRFQRKGTIPLCIGQKQKWFLLKRLGDDGCIDLEASESPEFDCWKWVSYWYPLKQVIFFKRKVYGRVLREFAPYVLKER